MCNCRRQIAAVRLSIGEVLMSDVRKGCEMGSRRLARPGVGLCQGNISWPSLPNHIVELQFLEDARVPYEAAAPLGVTNQKI